MEEIILRIGLGMTKPREIKIQQTENNQLILSVNHKRMLPDLEM